MIQTVLISFLGRAPKGESGYRKTEYDFDDGSKCEPVAFFGWSLARRLQPERLVILGTAGSMWDHLFEGDIALAGKNEEQRLQLIDAVNNQCVRQEQLDQLSAILSGQLLTQVELKIIPYCHAAHEQTDLIQYLAEQVEQGDRVHIDITHAFRHLPMIALMGVFYLQKSRGINIETVWYGAFDPDNGKARVHRLSSLLHLNEWVQALATYEKDGDYSVFSPLLNQELSQLLTEAAFFEQVNRIGQARSKARQALALLRNNQVDDPVAALFYPELIERLAWAEENQFYQRQRHLARQQIARKQFLQATLTMYEAFITGLVQQSQGQPDKPADRERARDDFDREEKKITPRRARYRSWDCLRRLRNSVAHGNQPKGDDVQRALSCSNEMEALLRELFEQLLLESRQPG